MALVLTMIMSLVTEIAKTQLLKLTGYKMPEWQFILLFMGVGTTWFFLFKKYFFQRGKHLELTELYLTIYSKRKRMYFKIL